MNVSRIEGVIVVGAGPVGFLIALGLARNGIPVTLLEAGEAIAESPRAAVYFPTTVKVLDELGVLEDALAVGLKNLFFCFRVLETGEVVMVDTTASMPADEPYPYNLHFGQHILARIVMDHLARIPHARVRFRHTVVGLEQDGSGVTLSADTPEGRKQVRSEWLVGADGAGSSVRRLLGLPFEGHTWPDRFVATNVRYPFDKFGFAPANMVADPVNWAVVARLGRENLWRVTYGEDATLPEGEALRRIPAHYRAIMPSRDEAYEVVAASPYRVHERCAPSFRVGRVLLAGDAAHVCNPCGGMGLTSGVIDAKALAQVLSAVIAGKAGEQVLDFYSVERRRVYHEVTSPIATEFKRRLSERDPDKRHADLRIFREIAENPKAAPQSASLSAQIEGRPMPV